MVKKKYFWPELKQQLDREHHDVLRINYKGRNLLRLAQLSFIIYG